MARIALWRRGHGGWPLGFLARKTLWHGGPRAASFRNSRRTLPVAGSTAGNPNSGSARCRRAPVAPRGQARSGGVMGGGIYDSLHATFARRRKAVRIITRNPSHFQHTAPDIEVLTP